jgi:NADPH:quinone reductase-like Zn-dependent oxidoreductase
MRQPRSTTTRCSRTWRPTCTSVSSTDHSTCEYLTRQTLFTHIATREATQATADDLFAVVGSGQVKIRIDQRYPLADVAQAHRDLEARKTTGSSVLVP